MIDLIIGAGIGYSEKQLRPFLKSLRLSGYGGRVVLFADGGGAKEALEWDVEVLSCPKIQTFPHAERFYWILEEVLRSEAQGVVCLDTRDVIFQTNPENLPFTGFHAFEEDSSMTIGTCPYNSGWVETGYGKNTLDLMKDYPISCVGSFCGDRVQVANHLHKLTTELKRLQPKTSSFQDQSCHNYIIRNANNDHQTIWNNEMGEVYTVGYIPYGTVKINGDMILNKNECVPSVIHQWERHPNLTELVNNLYL